MAQQRPQPLTHEAYAELADAMRAWLAHYEEQTWHRLKWRRTLTWRTESLLRQTSWVLGDTELARHLRGLRAELSKRRAPTSPAEEQS